MKQTAVEWLIQDLEERRILPDNLTLLRWSIDKAKEMEKQQIKDAQSYAISNADMTNNKGYFDCEQYYIETFKKD